MSNATKTIAVIGTGRMGGAIGGRLASLGHTVVYGSRSPDSEETVALVEKTGDGATAASPSEAAAAADIIVFAVPWAGAEEAVNSLGTVDGKTIIDVTNALSFGAHGLMEMASDTSSGESIQKWLPGSTVVKAFNTVGFHVIANPDAAGGPVSVPIVGDDADTKTAVADLVQTFGFETIDVGPLVHARALEMMSMIYIVPYLQGRKEDAFEYYLRRGAAPKVSAGVRAAG
ncbi:MAG: F420-dependent NADP oxidoreductase [Alphaproteobacteria bacterium]|nr:F420-dependent NADP oxidoreductase [Alphaproteobacteria bacterium]